MGEIKQKQMRPNAHLSKRIKDMHLQNPKISVLEISEALFCSYAYACECLDYKHDYKLVKSLSVENQYFLFTELFEKKVTSTPDKHILNGYEFNNDEKVYLKGYGFKF